MKWLYRQGSPVINQYLKWIINSRCLSVYYCRTDAGVHALHTTVHVDIEKRTGHEIKPEHVTHALNKHFKKGNIEIRILNTEHVPDTFHCRYGVNQRTYLYRLAVSKKNYLPDTDSDSRQKQFLQKFIPIEEQFRCFYLLWVRQKLCAQRSVKILILVYKLNYSEDEFDIEKAKEASKILIGRHDFRSFMSVSKENKTVMKKNMFAFNWFKMRSVLIIL